MLISVAKVLSSFFIIPIISNGKTHLGPCLVILFNTFDTLLYLSYSSV